MSLKYVKNGEVIVDQNDFGILVEDFVKNELRAKNPIESTWMDEHIRKWWPFLDEYHQRHIITSIEMIIALDEPPRYNREEMRNKDMWIKIVKDLRLPRSAFTVKYQCCKCKQKDIKLWRDYQTCADYCDLECASCLAPDIKVDDDGCCENEDIGRTDQLNGKVPAVPVGDTYWGYSSVPSQDLEWWKNLPTYKK